MNDIKKTICPLPWLHLSAHLDSSMRICCNTDGLGLILDNDSKAIKLSDVDDLNKYFNLNHYKSIRTKMINGEKPKECNKCYQVEEHGGISTRMGFLNKYNNNEKWSELLENTKSDGEIEQKVSSLDFSLSNKCNLKCIMCSPDASILLKKDFDELEIPYSKEFTEGATKNWSDLTIYERLIPQIADTLEEFLTTGGEPFISKEHEFILEILAKSDNAKNIELTYHTNCTVSNPRLYELWHKFKKINIHFSIDAHGELDEYIRHQTKWEKVLKTTKELLEHPKTHCEVHTTVQVLNIFSLTELYKWIETLDGVEDLPFHIWMDNPTWLKINILPKNLKVMAFMKLKSFFDEKFLSYQVPESTKERAEQILSYLSRAIKEPHDVDGLAVFKQRIRKLETLRGHKPIEEIVPELKSLFKDHVQSSGTETNSFNFVEKSTNMESMNIFKEYIQFLKERKKIILIPIFLFVILISFLVYFTAGSAVSPFIYTLF